MKLSWLILSIVICLHGVRAQSLNLQQALDRALDFNPSLRSERALVNAEKAAWWTTISPENPEIFLEAEGIPRGEQDLSMYEDRRMGIAQSIEFPLSTIFKGQIQSQVQHFQAARVLSLEVDLRSRVKQVFYRLLMLNEQKLATENLLDITGRNLQKARIRVHSGDSSPYDTLKAKVDLVEVQNQMIRIESEQKKTQAELRQLLGFTQDMIRLRGSLEFEIRQFDLDSLIQIAEMHPDLMQADLSLAHHKTQKNLAWSRLLPSFHIKYFQQEFKGPEIRKGWGGEIGLSIPLWAPLRDQGRIRHASWSLNASKWTRTAESQKIIMKIQQAFAQLTQAINLVQNYRDNTLEEVHELVRIATRSYEEGEMSYLEMAEALRTLNRTKIGFAEAKYECHSALAQLEMAVGQRLAQ